MGFRVVVLELGNVRSVVLFVPVLRVHGGIHLLLFFFICDGFRIGHLHLLHFLRRKHINVGLVLVNLRLDDRLVYFLWFRRRDHINFVIVLR